MAATDDEDTSWRLCFLVPLALHILGGVICLTGRDLPDGNFKELETSGAKQKSNPGGVLKVGASNMNAWILTVTYGFCFGVELTMTNVAASYFYEYHGMSPLLSSVFGAPRPYTHIRRVLGHSTIVPIGPTPLQPPSSAWSTSWRARSVASGPTGRTQSSACAAASGRSGSGNRLRERSVSS